MWALRGAAHFNSQGVQEDPVNRVDSRDTLQTVRSGDLTRSLDQTEITKGYVVTCYTFVYGSRTCPPSHQC